MSRVLLLGFHRVEPQFHSNGRAALWNHLCFCAEEAFSQHFCLISVDMATGEEVSLDIADKNEQLAVEAGMVLGFVGLTSNIIRHREGGACDANCHQNYLQHDFKGALDANYAPGKQWTFETDGGLLGLEKEFAVRAHIEPGISICMSSSHTQSSYPKMYNR